MQSEITDMGAMCAPKSDQMNADDLVGGPQVFTIARLTRGNAEQPLNIYFVETDRPWRPCKSMMRVLAACWGTNPTTWPAGARVELFCDPTVKWGGVAVGGIRVSGLHPLPAPSSTVMLTVTRGKKSPLTVRRLPDQPTTPKPSGPATPEAIAGAIAHFGSAGVELAALESYLDAPRSEWTTADLTRLRGAAAKSKAEGVTLAEVLAPPAF